LPLRAAATDRCYGAVAVFHLSASLAPKRHPAQPMALRRIQRALTARDPVGDVCQIPDFNAI
jgi:hypothetical protein